MENNNMENFNFIFVGAGLSNLTAANYFLDNNISDFIILEKGRLLEDRFCYGAEKNTCIQCRDGCPVIEGVGGANALNGNKLCYFPASQNILNMGNNGLKDKATKYIKNIAQDYFEPSLNIDIKSTDTKKDYYSDVLNTNDFKNLINKFTCRLKKHIYTNANVHSILLKDSKVYLELDNEKLFSTDNLILGTGRTSLSLLKKFLDKNNIKYSFEAQDIGIRIESLKDNFTDNYNYQNDPKLKFTFESHGSGRTFCAVNQGRVIPVRFGNSFYAEGAFGNSLGKNNNIALMVRTNDSLNLYQIESWCSKINQYANKSLILGEVDISNNKDQMISEIMKLIPVFPTKLHKILFKNLLIKVLKGEFNIVDSNSKSGKIKVYGPAIDNYWIKPLIKKDFSIEGIRNIYLLGDIAGLSRGYIQAMYSGFFWASSYLNNNLDKLLNEKIFSWSNLV